MLLNTDKTNDHLCSLSYVRSIIIIIIIIIII